MSDELKPTVHREGVGKYIPKVVVAGVKRSSGSTEQGKPPPVKKAKQPKREYGDFSSW